MVPSPAHTHSTPTRDIPASETSTWTTQLRAMLRLRISLFQANVLSLGPFFLQPMIYITIVYSAAQFNSYKGNSPRLTFNGPSQVGAPFYNETFPDRTFITGTAADPVLSTQVFTRINNTYTANRQLAEGKWTTAMNPNYWHRANTLTEVSSLTFQFLGSAPMPKLASGHSLHPELSPPLMGYLVHSLPTAESPSSPLNMSIVVNINPGFSATKFSPTMLNSLTDSVQHILPASFASSIRNSTRNAVDQLVKLHKARSQKGASAPLAPWTVQLYGGSASFPVPLSETFDLIAFAMPPIFVFCVYLMLMGATRNIVSERVDGQFSYFVTNSLRPEMFYISAIVAYSYLALSVVVVMFFPIVNLRWMSTLIALALLVLFCVFMASQAALLSFAFWNKNSVPSILYLFVFFLSIGPQILHHFFGGSVPYSIDLLLTLVFPSYAIVQSFNDMSTAAFNEVPYRAFASHFPFALLALVSHIAINTFSVCHLARRDSRVSVTPESDSKRPCNQDDLDIEAAHASEIDLPMDPQVQAEMDRLRATSASEGDGTGDHDSQDVVCIKGLSMSFRSDNGRGPTRQVLNNLWFSVRKLELFAFLGPNGSGKSTTINILTGLLKATAGTATVRGKSPNDPEIKRLLGVCPQYDQAYPQLTVYHHLRAFAYIKGVPEDQIQEAIKSAVEAASLTEYLHRAVGALSGGTRRRLSIAIACIGRPAVVILDEPTTGVDVATRRAIWDMISKLKAHTSVLLVTHDMDEAERLAERAGILINGSLVCLGSPHRLKSLLGSAYLLKLQFGTTDTDGSLADRVLDDVEHKSKELIAGSRARVMYRGQSRIEVAVEKGPASFVDEEGKFVGNLLKFVASQRYMWRVSDWSLGEVSLGELFVRFARQHRAYQEEEL